MQFTDNQLFPVSGLHPGPEMSLHLGYVSGTLTGVWVEVGHLTGGCFSPDRLRAFHFCTRGTPWNSVKHVHYQCVSSFGKSFRLAKSLLIT
jgi:hypothetical protein